MQNQSEHANKEKVSTARSNMFNHEPADYKCPYCGFLNGKESEYNNKSDIVAQNDLATALMCPMSWRNNSGNVIVIPKSHYENIFTIPDEALDAVIEMVKQVSTAMRSTYDCSGIAIIQRNEPDAGQHVWHLHVHVVPRYAGDEFKENGQTLRADAATRASFAQKLRDYLTRNH